MSPASASHQTALILHRPTSAHSNGSAARQHHVAVLHQATQQQVAGALDAQVRKALASHGYQSLREVGVQVDAGLVRLTGRVNRFHHKQLATQAVLSIDGVKRLENDLQVCR